MRRRTSWAVIGAAVSMALATGCAPGTTDDGRLAKLEAEVEYLRDRQAIHDVLRRYARGTDRHDADLIRSVFWPDAQISYGRPVSVDEFVAWGIEAHAENFEQNAHHITAQTVDLDGDVAHVESYVIYFLLAGKKPGDNILASGRYIEKYEKRNGEWRIAVREFIRDVFYKATPLRDLCPEPHGCMGKRDRTDLSYMRPLVPQDDRPDRDGQPTPKQMPATR